VTGGSRVTFATGMASVEASKKIVDELRARAAMIWDVDADGVIWDDGHAKPASSNVGDFPPLSFKELAAKKALTGGPITAAASVNAGGMAPGFSTQFCGGSIMPASSIIASRSPPTCR
jgi:CO/xanthine dehydrogenase Mo-binding subunit